MHGVAGKSLSCPPQEQETAMKWLAFISFLALTVVLGPCSVGAVPTSDTIVVLDEIGKETKREVDEGNPESRVSFQADMLATISKPQ